MQGAFIAMMVTNVSRMAQTPDVSIERMFWMDRTQRMMAAVMMNKPEQSKRLTRIFCFAGIWTFHMMGTGMKHKIPMSVLQRRQRFFFTLLEGESYRTLRVVTVR